MKNYLLSSVLLISGGLAAQPVLTVNDMFSVGSTFTAYAATNPAAINLALTGADVTWDFSSLQLGASSVTTVLSPSGVQGASYFPEATFAVRVTSQQGHETNTFQQVRSSGVSLNGVYQPSSQAVTVIEMDPPMDYFRFPLTYNSQFTQDIDGTSTSTVISGVIIYDRIGTQTIVCDGYGTLITPLGTFQNVLRLKTTQTYSDVSAQYGTFNYNVTAYTWISAASKTAALLSHSTISVNNAPSNPNVTLMGLPTVSIHEQDELSFSVHPNPSNGLIRLALPSSASDATVEVLSADGRSILQTNALQVHSLDLSHLEKGLYIIRCSTKNAAASRRLILN